MISRALVVALFLQTMSCSLLVDNASDQCASDVDCARFSGTSCDLRVHLCKPGDNSSISDAAPVGDAAGMEESPGDACGAIVTFQNACTNASCKPFNNRQRLARLPIDGGLTPLPTRDAGRYDGGGGGPVVVDAWRDEATTDDAGKDGD